VVHFTPHCYIVHHGIQQWKKWLKSVYLCQSYHKNKSGSFFMVRGVTLIFVDTKSSAVIFACCSWLDHSHIDCFVTLHVLSCFVWSLAMKFSMFNAISIVTVLHMSLSAHDCGRCSCVWSILSMHIKCPHSLCYIVRSCIFARRVK